MYSKNASDLNVPYCEMGQALDCKSSPLIAPWPLSMRFRVVAMLQEAYLKFTSNTNFNEKRLVTLEILKQMGSQLTAEGTRVYLILYEIDPQSKKEYQEFLSKTNINVIDCSNIVQLHKREDLILQDGHPNAFAAGLIAECIEKSIPNLGLLHQD